MSEHRPQLQWSMGAAGPVLAILAADVVADWRDFAACAQAGGDAWFPEPGEGVKYAKRVCEGCFVREECLEYALERAEAFGIWGGLSPQERRAIRRERAA